MPDSIYNKILDQVHTDILALSLSGVSDSNVKVIQDRRAVEEVLPGLPGIIVLPTDAERIEGGGPVGLDDVAYPVLIVMLDSEVDNPENTGTTMDARLLWRQKIRKKFLNQPLSLSATGLVRVWACRMVPRPIIDNALLARRNLWASMLVFLFVSRETRG